MILRNLRITAIFALVVLTGCGAGSVKGSHMTVGTEVFPPAITMLEPQSSPVGAVAFTMTVVGKNFGPDAIVYWNGIPAHTTPITAQQLLADITSEDLQMAGMANVYVRTGGQNSNTVTFEVNIQ